MKTIHLCYDIDPLPIPRRSTIVGARAFVRKVARFIERLRKRRELEIS